MTEVMNMRCEQTSSPSPFLLPYCLSPKDLHTSRSKGVASPLSPSSPPSPPPLEASGEAVAVASPCAACKILRRRCSAEKCVLAPYFPPTDPLKFATAHKVFGASNIIKLLQELPESQRADAVSSMVYEANARLRDPVYGTAGAICQLQKQLSQLQAELAKAQAELLTMKCQQSNLIAMIINTNNVAATAAPTSSELENRLLGSFSSSSDYSDHDSPMSDPDGFFNFYPDTSNSTLITWDDVTI